MVPKSPMLHPIKVHKVFLALCFQVLRHFESKFALVAMVIFGFTYYLTEQFLVYSDNIFSLIPNIIMFASLSIGLYFIITYLIDKKIRNLVNAVIYEIKTRVS